MQVGVYTFSTDRDMSPGRLAREVEDRGFRALMFTEHSHIPVSRDTAYPEPRQHFTGMPVLEGSSERCLARTYWIVIYRRADGEHLLKSFGEYVDQCVKVDGRWLVDERRIIQWGK